MRFFSPGLIFLPLFGFLLLGASGYARAGSASALKASSTDLDTAALRRNIEYPKDAVKYGIAGVVRIYWYPAKGKTPPHAMIASESDGLFSGAVRRALRAIDPRIAIVEIRDSDSADMKLYRVTFRPDSAGGKPVGRIIVAEERAPVAISKDGIITQPTASDTERYPDIDEFTMVEHAPMWDMADLQRRLVYPEEAARNNIGGDVIVRALIDRHGRVVKTHVDKCDNPLLRQPAVDAIVGTTFTPAINEGKPVAVWVQMPVTFKISGH